MYINNMQAMDHDFTSRLSEWLETDAAIRDYAAGALMLLQLTGNRIMYRNLMLDTPTNRQHLEHQLKAQLQFRLAEQEKTRAQSAIKLTPAGTTDRNAIDAASKSAAESKGKRQDHDSLPVEIQVLYTENLTLLREMRELHLELRRIEAPDHEAAKRAGLVRKLIQRDKRLRDNWLKYDQYKP